MKRTTIRVTAFGAAAVSAMALTTAPALAAGSLPTMTLTVTKNNVVIGGAKTSGAVNVVTTVAGETADQPALLRLKPGVTPAQFGQAVGKLGNSPLDAIDPYATIVFDAPVTTKGRPSTAQVDLPAGTYVAVNNGNAFVPFTVSRSTSPRSLPAPAATVTAIDFAYRGPTTLHHGELVRFVNDGYLIHMFAWGRTKNAAVAKRAETLLQAGKDRQAAKLASATGMFAGPMSSGQTQQEIITEPPGVYVLYCGMNAQDGREHSQLGMFRTIHIVK